jgi:hypothetical protein
MRTRAKITVAASASVAVIAAGLAFLAIRSPADAQDPPAAHAHAQAQAPVLATARPAAVTACATHWGVSAKTVTRAETVHTARIQGARAGAHPCYDRLVIDVGGGARPGYRVQYVTAVHAQGSGKVIKLRGHAALQVTLTGNAAAKYPAAGHSLASVAGFGEFRQVLSAGSFEGYTELGIGVRAKKPFRVEWLAGPGKHSRLVIDVAVR